MKDVVVTREVSSLPSRSQDAHKGDVGRIAIVGGCYDEVVMIGAPALAANAALRAGAGLVQILVPEQLRTAAAVLAPCATVRTMPRDTTALVGALEEFGADVAVLGPGLGSSLEPPVVAELLRHFPGMIVVDADAINALALMPPFKIPQGNRVVLTPHPGEARRLLAASGAEETGLKTTKARQNAALTLVRSYGCVVTLKGQGTVVTDGVRLYVNETGNSGMATGGSGDVLTGVIAALLGQRMISFEAAVLGVYLHGLAGDFAAEELGRCSMTATDLIEYLPEAFCEHESAEE